MTLERCDLHDCSTYGLDCRGCPYLGKKRPYHCPVTLGPDGSPLPIHRTTTENDKKNKPESSPDTPS